MCLHLLRNGGIFDLLQTHRVPGFYRGTSLIRTPPPPQDYDRVLGIGLR